MVWEWVMVDIGMRDGLVVDEVLDDMFEMESTVSGIARALVVGTVF